MRGWCWTAAIGVCLGLSGGACSSTQNQAPAPSDSGSPDDQTAIIQSGTGGTRVDYWDAGETDVCSVFDCAGPAPVDSGPPPPPPGCPSLADYCARMQGKGCNGGTSLSDVNCDCVATWPTALTSHCGGFNYATRYLNCDGFNAFVGASIEFGGIFYYDATTLALVAIASTGPVTSLPSSTFPAHCLAGEIPQIDPATCASVIAAPPLCGP